MSNRAEIAALETYPKHSVLIHPARSGGYYADNHLREGFIKGYEQAEKDLALTIEDLELLHTFLYAVKNNKQGCFTFTRLNNEQYEEVLRRFNNQRGKK